MSSRQLRKLQQQKELDAAQARLQAQEEEEESEDEPVAPTKSKPSLFANFAALGNEDEDDEEDEPEEAETTNSKPLNDPAPTTAKKSKKSKKKKKAKNKGKENVSEAKEDDDIDAALRDLALENRSGSIGHASVPAFDPEYERICELLGVSTNHLKVGNEMRNLFGKNVMDNHDDAGGAVPRGGRGRRQRGAAQENVDLETALKGHHLPGKGLPEVTLRRNIFIQGKDDWPRGTSGLSIAMVDDRSDDGTVEYRFVHDQAYQELQQNFQAFVEMGVPQNLIALLTKNPYHISLLIQVSKIAKDQSDHSLSSDLLERALFSFARAANAGFATKLAQGKVRLDFTRPENRELWLAAYQYIKSLVMKGTYRTALEWAKLMLSIDPEGDPYCMRLVIHHLAIRASEYEWLLNVSESKIPSIWSPVGLQESKAVAHTSPSLAFAALQLRQGPKARKLLTESMKTVPWLFTRLFKELNLDAPPSIWGVQPRTDAETLFSEIYVLQTKDLWNTPEATALLMEIGHTIKEIKVSAIPKLENKEMTLDVVRFVYLDNTPALMSMVPSRLLHRENNSDSDPLPPDSNTFSYDSQRAWINRGLERNESAFGADNYMNPFAAMRRLIPGFGAVGADNQEDGDEDDINNLRRQLEHVVRGERAGREPSEGMPMGFAQSLLNMLGFGRGVQESEDEDEDEYLDAEDGEETDYDDLPNLVGSDGEVVDEGGSDDDDDEMPGLVPH